MKRKTGRTEKVSKKKKELRNQRMEKEEITEKKQEEKASITGCIRGGMLCNKMKESTNKNVRKKIPKKITKQQKKKRRVSRKIEKGGKKRNYEEENYKSNWICKGARYASREMRIEV